MESRAKQSKEAGVVLLTRAMQVMQTRQVALERVPHHQDMMRMLRRTGASPRLCEMANTAWSLMSDERDTRVLYLAFSVLGDETIREAMGALPDDAGVKITDVVRRVAERMRSPEGLESAALHEELLRGLAMHLGLTIEEEREATSSYLFHSSDGVLIMLRQHKKGYDLALSHARQAVDLAHRPARPYGE